MLRELNLSLLSTLAPVSCSLGTFLVPQTYQGWATLSGTLLLLLRNISVLWSWSRQSGVKHLILNLCILFPFCRPRVPEKDLIQLHTYLFCIILYFRQNIADLSPVPNVAGVALWITRQSSGKCLLLNLLNRRIIISFCDQFQFAMKPKNIC